VAVLAREDTEGGAAGALAAAGARAPSASGAAAAQASDGSAEAALAALAATRVACLCHTLLCSPTAAALALRRERALLATGAAALAARVLALRAAAPGADLSRLTLACPRLLVAPPADVARFAASVAALRAALPGVDVDTLAQEDPELLLSDTSRGVASLGDLWRPEELATLEPEEAALALRALCGLPRRGLGPQRPGPR
jgi:hypothetical protein